MLRCAFAFAVLALTASPAFAITSVPEPATLALTGLGAVAAILSMKRR